MLDGADQCPNTPFANVVDPASGCSIVQICTVSGPLGSTTRWKNHEQYEECNEKTTKAFVKKGLITKKQKNDEDVRCKTEKVRLQTDKDDDRKSSEKK